MRSNYSLEYDREKLFNSTRLQEYDREGQNYFLGYLIRKNYNFQIKDNKIVFVDIFTKKMINSIINQYNNEMQRNNINKKLGAIKDIEVMGTEEYKEILEKKLKELEEKPKSKYRER